MAKAKQQTSMVPHYFIRTDPKHMALIEYIKQREKIPKGTKGNHFILVKSNLIDAYIYGYTTNYEESTRTIYYRRIPDGGKDAFVEGTRDYIWIKKEAEKITNMVFEKMNEIPEEMHGFRINRFIPKVIPLSTKSNNSSLCSCASASQINNLQTQLRIGDVIYHRAFCKQSPKDSSVFLGEIMNINYGSSEDGCSSLFSLFEKCPCVII